MINTELFTIIKGEQVFHQNPKIISRQIYMEQVYSAFLLS